MILSWGSERKSHMRCGSSIIASCLVLAGWGGTPAPAQCEPELVGSLSGSVFDVEFAGDIAYLAASYGGIHVLDISDPTRPTLIGKLDQLTRVWGIELWGDVLVASVGFDGLVTVDISEPTAPVLLGSLVLPYLVTDVSVSAGRAYASTPEAMFIVDITDPTTPRLLGSYEGKGLQHQPIIDGDIAFVPVHDAQEVHVLDVSDPASPSLLATLDVTTEPNALRLIGTQLQIATDTGMAFADVSNPAAPELIRTIRTFIPVNDVETLGGFAYWAMPGPGIWVIDLMAMDQTRIVDIGLFDEGRARRVKIRDGLAYVPAEEGGLQILDIADPTNLYVVGAYKAPYRGRHVQLHDGIAYLGERSLSLSRIMAVDVRDPTFPTVLGSLVLDGDIEAIEADPQNGVMYVVDSDHGLRLLDISDPTDIQLISTIDAGAGARMLVRRGDRLYVPAGGQLMIFDISDRFQPTLLSETRQSMTGMDVSGTFVILSTHTDGLQIIDASDPTQPITVGAFPLQTAHGSDVIVRDGLAYFAVSRMSRPRRGDPAGLYIIDISQPDAPTLVSIIDRLRLDAGPRTETWFNGMGLHRGVVYLDERERGVELYDVSNPARPRFFDAPGSFVNVPSAFDADLAYFGSFPLGLRIFDISTCGRCAADLDGDGDADAEDFLAYLDAFANGEVDICDIDADGDCDAEDFFGYLDLFADGCD